MKRPRRTTIAAAAGAFAVAAVIGLALFQPWRLFTDTVVDETLPGTAPISMNPSSTTPPTISVPPESSATKPTPPRVPDPTEAPGPATLAKGTFISHEHDTSGTVKIVRLADGSRVLRLENLDTSDGPDLEVWLTNAPVLEGTAGWRVFDDGKYQDLGKLKGNKGNQNYAIPPDLNLKDFTSVSIWCDRFNVSFGAATLS
ncbi:DM13 domain-containing protein [Kribbella sp. NBC_01245]|uniref:DM13 domain-containing protein n=1 Tax=Kribbella sp. NBC_01245 TaxID=2903578 RepID=UPI002E29CB21|nr:DM13 domain-containing protein [Kribbella sp. NBC_01245]